MNPADKIKRYEPGYAPSTPDRPQGKPWTNCTAAICKEIDQAYLPAFAVTKLRLRAGRSDVAPIFRSEGGLNRLIENTHLRVVGLMSGTSMNGLDFCVTDIDLSENKLNFEK